MMRGGIADMSDINPPVLICADLQCEYLAQGRRHLIAEADAVIPRCLELMTLWRDNLWPVIHLKRIAQAAWFNPASNLTDWIAELKPQPGELAFEHPLPSAYSSSRFTEYMASIRGGHCLMVGCSLDETILATVIDGFHRGHRFGVVGDAVTCVQSVAGNAGHHRASMLAAISKFAGVGPGSELISCASSEA
jgi:nicotinamidase-related amidase